MTVPPSIIEALRQAIGLEVESIGLGTLAAALERQVAGHPGGRADLERACLTDRSVLDGLIEEVVVGETWFFRDRVPFAFLADWARRAAATRGSLRVLSLPCSTGEEPYSIAITLIEAGLEPGQVTIDAVDISRRALARALAARYGRGSFRGGLDGIERHLLADGAERVVADPIRQLVDFQLGNILDGDLLASRKYDVVFCRNLLIYLDRRARALALRTLERLLAPGGLLVVGHTEGTLPDRHRFQPVGGPATFAFERRDASAPLPQGAPDAVRATTPIRRAPDPVRATTPIGRAPRPVRSAPVPPPPHPTPPAANGAPESEDESLAPAAEAANAGRLDWAAAFCLEYIDRRGPSVEAFHLLGVVHSAQGAIEAAEEDFRRALYLDGDHYESLAQLALLRQLQGDQVGAANLSRRAARVHARRREER